MEQLSAADWFLSPPIQLCFAAGDGLQIHGFRKINSESLLLSNSEIRTALA